MRGEGGGAHCTSKTRAGVGRTALRCRASPCITAYIKQTYHESNAQVHSNQVMQPFKFTAITIRKLIDL